MNFKNFLFRLINIKNFDFLLIDNKYDKNTSLLHYPKGGEVFEAIEEVEISYFTYFMKPYTGGGKTKLLKGERVLIYKPKKHTYPLNYICYPINADKVEKKSIPVKERNDPAYDGFNLYIETKTLFKSFEKIKLFPIKFEDGDATNPTTNDIKIIINICDTMGGWEKDFQKRISKKWRQPKDEYINWYKNKELKQSNIIQFERLKSRDRYSNEKRFEMGNVQFVNVSKQTWIANMIAKDEFSQNNDRISRVYYECFQRVRQFAKRNNASVHIQKTKFENSSVLWREFEEIVNDNLIAHEINTIVYDFV